MRKLEKVLIDALGYLFLNNLTITEFQEKNPFPKKPFSLKCKLHINSDSYEFLEAVKFDKIELVKDFINSNKYYLFEFDYFRQTCYHWAAKRGYNDMLKLLISRGCYINQYDNNKRTPLWLAAKNNQFQACQILLENKANPFMDNKENKKPFDVTTDVNIKKLLGDYMETCSYMNSKNFFKTRVLKKHREDFLSILTKNTTEKMQKRANENLRGISRVSILNNNDEFTSLSYKAI